MIQYKLFYNLFIEWSSKYHHWFLPINCSVFQIVSSVIGISPWLLHALQSACQRSFLSAGGSTQTKPLPLQVGQIIDPLMIFFSTSS